MNFKDRVHYLKIMLIFDLSDFSIHLFHFHHYFNLISWFPFELKFELFHEKFIFELLQEKFIFELLQEKFIFGNFFTFIYSNCRL